MCVGAPVCARENVTLRGQHRVSSLPLSIVFFETAFLTDIGIPERTTVPSSASSLCWDDRHIPLHSESQHGS